MHLWHILGFSLVCCSVYCKKKTCLMRHQGLSRCHKNCSWSRLDTDLHTLTLFDYICCCFPLCHFFSSQLYWHIHSFCPYLSIPLYLSIQMSLSSSPLPHNHLTPLRDSAETSFTPLSSLWLQVLLALTHLPLSNQHLLGFIPLSTIFPSWLSSFCTFPVYSFVFMSPSFTFPSSSFVRLIPLFSDLQ